MTPHAAAHRPRRRRLLIALGALVVVAGVAIVVVRSVTTPAWEQAAIDMAPEFRRLALPAHPTEAISLSRQTDKWRSAPEGVSVDVTYREGQTLDSIQRSVESATEKLGLLPPVCIQVDAEEGYERTGHRTRDGMLGCSIFDADRHAVGLVQGEQDGERTTVWLDFGAGSGTLGWMHLDPDDLP